MINIWKSHYLFVSLYKSNNKTMTNTKEMTRKEAATIMKKYEKYGGIGWNGTFPKQEYFIAKQRWNEIVKEQEKLRN